MEQDDCCRCRYTAYNDPNRIGSCCVVIHLIQKNGKSYATADQSCKGQESSRTPEPDMDISMVRILIALDQTVNTRCS